MKWKCEFYLLESQKAVIYCTVFAAELPFWLWDLL